jgi:hemoglobin-like flavoprotein
MTPEHIDTVQSTWLKVLPIRDAAAQLFCERLLQMDPSLRGLIRGDTRQQGARIMRVVDATVNGLTRLERVVPLLEELGRRYASHGVKDDHYATVGAALLWSLAQALGTEFTPKAKVAWATVYAVLALTMREAAASRPVRGPWSFEQPSRRDAA